MQANDNLNLSEITSSTNKVTILNSAPTSSLPTYIQNSSGVFATTTITDDDGDVINTTFSWYKNNVFFISNSTNKNNISGTSLTVSLTIYNYSTGDKVNMTILTNDSFNWSTTFSPGVTIISIPIPTNITGNVSLLRNYTITEFTDYIETFFSDWDDFILVILTFGLSFVITQRPSQMLTVAGVGLVAVFFFIGNITILAGALICLLIGWGMKYVSG